MMNFLLGLDLYDFPGYLFDQFLAFLQLVQLPLQLLFDSPLLLDFDLAQSGLLADPVLGNGVNFCHQLFIRRHSVSLFFNAFKGLDHFLVLIDFVLDTVALDAFLRRWHSCLPSYKSSFVLFLLNLVPG